MGILAFFKNFSKVKNLQKEVEEKSKLCELQATLNMLDAEAKVIESISEDEKITDLKEITDKTPHSVKIVEESF